ncbi:MAG: hypothetical protein IKU76_00410 [Bacteroidaceae bacterium]|nr:hypothetical protein [Bacteroidaceae bacterium]
MRRPSIFEIATAFEDGKNGEIKRQQKPKTNVVVNTNRIGYGEKSTVSAFLATAYDEQGNTVDSMRGYFLEPGTDYNRAKREGSDTAIMSGSYEIIPQAEMRKRIAERNTQKGKQIKECDIKLRYNWYIDNPPGRSGIAIHGGRNGENTTGCFIPGDSISPNKENTDYFISDNGKKNELFRFFNNYGQDGIKINVGPDFEDLYK